MRSLLLLSLVGVALLALLQLTGELYSIMTRAACTRIILKKLVL